MIAAVANTLARCRDDAEQSTNGEHLAAIEAGTGTGKSIGALVPALVMARSRGKRLVVSSSTVALQHQYATKDVPALQGVAPFPIRVAVAKGRRRYVCVSKLMAKAQEVAQRSLAMDSGQASVSPTIEANGEARRTILLWLADSFEGEQWRGDRDDLPMPVAEDLWTEISTDRQGCSGSRCAEFARCPFYAARQRVREADLVIANHDLVLSALDMDVGSVLPPPHETVYVFDEAHSLAAKAVEHLSSRHALRGAQEWLQGSVDAVRDALLALRLPQELLAEASERTALIVEQLELLRARIHALRAFEEKKARRFRTGGLPEWVRAAGERVLAAAHALARMFTSLREQVLERAPSEGVLAGQMLSSTGFFVGKLENLIDTWELLLSIDEPGEAPVARWVERQDDERGVLHDYLVCAAPISGSQRLRSLLWHRCSGAILMSATLTSCGTFDLFLRQAGLNVYEAMTLLQVDSPFDYRANAKLVIPAMRCDPKDAERHTDEVISRMPGLTTARGTLVLFASAKQMRAVHARLSAPLKEITLMQGLVPRTELLARHRQAIDEGGRSMLFGLQSLAEGVDLPGAYCEQVVVAKLPFSQPDSPLEEARREWIESQGRSSFLEVTVPETAVRFKQIVGRLIRTTEDTGTVTVLDRRLVTARWGRLLMAGLPDFEIVIERFGHAHGTERSP